MAEQIGMTLEQAQQWVDALNSGKYLQGEGQLCKITNGGKRLYCCLGVAKELFGLKVGEHAEIEGDIYIDYNFLPKEIQLALAARNDGWSSGAGPFAPWTRDQRMTFPEIANFIEREIIPLLEPATNG